MGKTNKNTLFYLMLVTTINFQAQNEFSKWYFGGQAGLDFSTSPPTVLTNGVINTSEGVATICDSGGNMLFCSDGINITNSNQVTMANGGGLFGNLSSTQAVIIVKQPGNNILYYVFTTDQSGGPNGLRYSIVDMNLSAGMGSVTVKNVSLYTPTCEKLLAVRHCNGKDAWIVTHDYNSNQFRTFLLNNTGLVMPPVISAIGDTPIGNGVTAFGHLKISPDGRKLAMATSTNSIPASLGSGGFYLFDFDASTGIISNSLTIITAPNLPQAPYGVEFSPDGSKLYGTTSSITSTNSCTLHQWDICAANSSAIIASQYSINLTGLLIVGSVQRAIDGKLYITAVGVQSLSVINNPNSSGAGMNFVQNGLSIAPKSGRLGLPNYINTYIKPSPLPFTNTVACQTTSFSAPPAPTFSSGCTSTPYPPSNYLWDFGEPAAGASNSSTLTNPVQTYSTLGTYTVSLILYSNCTNDTLKKVITISTPGPSINVTGVFEICKGDKRTYTVTGASTYVWSNNSTSTTATFSPIVTTAYSVTGTATNGCKASKSFTANVNPCLGIVSNEKNLDLRVYPNPVKDLLSIEAVNIATVMIYDMNGTLVLESKINAGHNEVNTSELKPGVYFIKSTSGSGIWRGRLVKMD